MSVDDESAVRFNPETNRYELVVDGYLSVLEFLIDGQRMIVTHTFVPPELRGRGLAEKLVRVALADARTKGFKVVPACPYVAKFVERHAEYQDLIAP